MSLSFSLFLPWLHHCCFNEECSAMFLFLLTWYKTADLAVWKQSPLMAFPWQPSSSKSTVKAWAVQSAANPWLLLTWVECELSHMWISLSLSPFWLIWEKLSSCSPFCINNTDIIKILFCIVVLFLKHFGNFLWREDFIRWFSTF